MYKPIRSALLAFMVLFVTGADATEYGVGRTATKAEIAAWDIDVRPDFKGLPKGSGSVEAGEELWENKCSACHGSFGESNEVFTPLVGGVTPEDIRSGRVKSLMGNGQPHRTTFMKVATLSSIWDYINRAMPWNAPKSLSPDEVYAVTAYLLNLSDIVGDDFVLSDENIQSVQERMPNRNGMTFKHGLRTVNGTPDVKNKACMKDCGKSVSVHSTLPESARNTHGNVQLQNRPFGAVRGVDTTKPPLTTFMRAEDVMVVSQEADGEANHLALAKGSGCLSCHGVDNKIVGPSFKDVAAKYKTVKNAQETLVGKVMNGGGGNWGEIEMPAQKNLDKDQIALLVQWILAGAK